MTIDKLPLVVAAVQLDVSEISPAAAVAEIPPDSLLEAETIQALHDEQMRVEAEPEKTINTGKFLLVDDNHINLRILSAYMGKMGRTYEAVINGKEAVDAYTQRPSDFSAILMDISMPVMDGLEATRRIRAHEHRNELCGVAILALTGLASDSTHQEALESGVDVFLTKPVRLKTLSQVLGSMGISPPPKADEALAH